MTVWFFTYLAPYASIRSPMRTPMVPSRNQTSGWCLKTSALTRMENPKILPTKELNPEGQKSGGTWHFLKVLKHNTESNRISESFFCRGLSCAWLKCCVVCIEVRSFLCNLLMIWCRLFFSTGITLKSHQ